VKDTNLYKIHLSVFLFGFASLFGKWILLDAISIVWGRVFFASISFAVFFLFQRENPFDIPRKALITNLLLGALLAFHWWSFYQSVQLSTVAIGLFCFSTFPIFTVFLTPLLSNTKISYSYFLFAIMSMLGIYILLPDFNWQDKNTLAIFYGILSGLSFALLTISNGKLSKQQPAEKLAFLQDFFAFIILSPIIITQSWPNNSTQWAQLAILGTVFTALAHVLFVSSLRTIKAQTAAIIANLEPVYGVILAYFLLREHLSTQHMIGGGIIILAALLSSRKPKKTKT
jgi:drug/metabolite transporter (DMT)-like permease